MEPSPTLDRDEINRRFDMVREKDVVARFYHNAAKTSGLDEMTILKATIVELSKMHLRFYKRYMKTSMMLQSENEKREQAIKTLEGVIKDELCKSLYF